MLNKIHTLLLLGVLAIISLGKLSSQTSHRLPDEFFTNRIEDVEDTLYLPIEDTCLIMIMVTRVIKTKEKIDNTVYLQTTHRYTCPLSLLQSTSQEIIDEYTWRPTHYKRIFPFFTLIYSNDASSSDISTRNKNTLRDAVYTQEDTTIKIPYFSAEFDSQIGNQIAENMLTIEAFLCKKIHDEVTLIYDTDLICEQVFIRIIPDSDFS